MSGGNAPGAGGDRPLSSLEAAVLRESPFPVFAADIRYRTVYHNEAILQLLGLTQEPRLIRRTCYSFFYHFDKPCSFCPFTSSRSLAEPQTHALTITIPNELLPREIHLEIRHVVIEDRAQGKIVIEYLRDITWQRLKEMEFKRNERLIALGLVTRLVAHELQNPLAGINLTLQTLMSIAGNKDELQKKVEIMQRDLEMARLIIADIQNFNRRDALQMQSLELKKLLEDSINSMRRLAPRSRAVTDVQFRLFWRAAPDIKIFGNETRLHQVLANLIKNSYDAAQRPGRRPGPLIFWISVSLKEQEDGGDVLTRLKSRPLVEVRIIDNAGGISKDVLRRIFDPFFTTKKKTVKGSGLGLFVVQKILEEHLATIDMTSRGHYATVTLLFELVE